MKTPPLILVVDDSEDVLYSVCKVVESAGYDVIAASSARAGMEIARKQQPDLVLLDVMMPEMDGFEALRRIRADPDLKNLFIVHLSAMDATTEVKMSGLWEGADGFIEQPVENRELLARIEAFIRHKATLDSLRASESRYRALFESNPHPMWIWANSGKMLAVNDAAIRALGMPREKLLTMREGELLQPIEGSSDLLLGLSTSRKLYAHQTADKKTLEFEIAQQDVDWADTPARAVIGFDVTERNRVEREKLQRIDRFLRELDSAARINTGEARKTETKQETPIRQKVPNDFDKMIETYIDLLKIELDRLVFRGVEAPRHNIKDMAEKLFALGATGRDVIELHYSALKKLAPSPDAPRAQGYMEVARLTILEMLSHLLYRYRAVAKVAESIRPNPA